MIKVLRLDIGERRLFLLVLFNFRGLGKLSLENRLLSFLENILFKI